MREPFGELRPYLVQILHPLGTVEGTGFLCHPDGFVITCWHVMESWSQLNRTRGKVRFGSQEQDAEWLIEKSDQAADLALLKLTKPDDQKSPYLPLDVHWRVQIPDHLESFGYPKGQFGQQGIATAPQLQGLTPSQLDGITAYPLMGLNLDNIDSGYSGAPVVNRATQKVIGLVHAKQHKTQAFLIPLKPLFAHWPEMGAFHDVFKQIRQQLGAQAQARLDERLRNAPFIPPNLELGTIPKREERTTRPEPVADLHTYAHGRRWEAFSLKQLLPPRKALVLSSDVGTGKSVFLDWLAVELVSKTRTAPIVMTCEMLERRNPHKPNEMIRIVVEQLQDMFSSLDLEAFAEETAQKGELVFLFDGLDQIGKGKPSTLVTQILSIVGRQAVVITSRPSAVLAFENEAKMDFLRLQLFSSKDQRVYFGAHYARAKALCSTAPDLARVPMLAYMVRELLAVGKSDETLTRTELYERFLQFILSAHEPNRPISFDSPDLAREVQHELQRLAFSALAAETPSIQKVPMSAYPKDARVRIAELPTFGLLNRVVDQGEEALFFTHQSFQEFLAAKHAVTRDEWVEQILNERWHPKWAGVMQFLAGLQGESFIKRILSEADNVIHSNLFLAAGCAAEIKTLSANLKGPLVGRLIKLSEMRPFRYHGIRALSRISRYLGRAQIEWVLRSKLNDGDLDVIWAALELLGGVGNRLDDAEIKVIVSLLHPGDPRVRWPAIVALGRLGRWLGASDWQAIVNLLRDQDPTMQKAAVEALGELEEWLDEATFSALVGMLDHQDSGVRVAAVQAIGGLSKPLDGATLPIINDLLRDDDGSVRMAAVEVLRQRGGWCDAAVRTAIAGWLRDKDPHVRQTAVEAFGKLGEQGDAATVSALVGMLQDEDSRVRAAAVEALGGLGEQLDAATLSTIVGLLRDEDWSVRREAVSVLGQLGDRLDKVAHMTLVERLRDTNAGVCEAAVEALGRLGDQLSSTARIQIAKLVGDKNQYVCMHAVEALGRLGGRLDPATWALIITLTGHGDTDVRAAAGMAFRQLADQLDPTTRALIVTRTGHTDTSVRRAAVWVLERIGNRLDAAMLTALVDRLDDPDAGVRQAAVEVLGGLSELGERLDAATLSTIVGLLRDEDRGMRQAAVEVLGGLSERLDAATLSTIVGLLRDEDWNVRQAAGRALKQVGKWLDGRALSKLVQLLGNKECAENVYNVLEQLYQAGIMLPTTTQSKSAQQLVKGARPRGHLKRGRGRLKKGRTR